MPVNTNKLATLEHLGNLAQRTVSALTPKVDKVSSPTTGNVPVLASDGGITNSTIVGSNVLTKVSGATAGNFVIFASDGSIADSTCQIATDAEAVTMLDGILPTVSSGS